ncbi:MAG: Hpt domain-containing protein [Xanthobacteraceae bacterium]
MVASCVNIASASSPRGPIAGTADGQGVLDEDHLERMTLGDRVLEREVLEIFIRQNTVMLARITDAKPEVAAAAAHALAGSACGIGAWRLARAAERLERAGNAGGPGGEDNLDEAIAELKSASLEAGAAIGARLNKRALWVAAAR